MKKVIYTDKEKFFKAYLSEMLKSNFYTFSGIDEKTKKYNYFVARRFFKRNVKHIYKPNKTSKMKLPNNKNAYMVNYSVVRHLGLDKDVKVTNLQAVIVTDKKPFEIVEDLKSSGQNIHVSESDVVLLTTTYIDLYLQ